MQYHRKFKPSSTLGHDGNRDLDFVVVASSSLWVSLQGFQEILEAFKLFACPLGRTQLQSWPIREHHSSPKSLKSFPAVPNSPHRTSHGGDTGTLTPSSTSLQASNTAPSETAPASATAPSEDDEDLGGASGLSTGLHAGALQLLQSICTKLHASALKLASICT